ncbi:ABC transporter ATP-binding protein [Acutalibacter sp. 1XD8-36]|uniref:ABC transporter ATP-binding protein n=1 Tax=Acutalibacter sp. 1XD8-36 TaxID=2320852 RepID=UPI001412B43B|nr:ABC transporter ATP-binding protein [Acutalibacter sp. 1XD8-36]NBJ89021.1 ABC transporter ATP-binding protein [Acutalibacter sp. 1XD8-36]
MIRKLSRAIREYRRDTVLTPLTAAMEVVMEVIIPVLMAGLIDNGINAGDMGVIWKTGLLLVLCAIVSLAFGVLSGFFGARASTGFARNLRQDMYYAVQKYSFSNIDKFSTGSIVTRLTTDVTNIQNTFQMLIRIAVRAPSTLIFSMIMAFWVNARLALLFLAAIPVLGAGLAFISMKAHPAFTRMFKHYDRMNTVVQENLRGIRVVKAFVREDHETQKFVDASEKLRHDSALAEKILAFNSPLMQFCMYGIILLISWFGAKLIVGSSMTTGQLMSMMSYAMQVLMALMMLTMILVMGTMSRASATRVVEILDEKSDILSGEKNLTTVKDGSIQFKDVDFNYKRSGRACLSGINLDIKSGQTVGILGGTGSGKSSLVQMIPRLYDVISGQVLVGGEDVRDYNVEALREEVAMVLQKNELFSGTIKDNLRWGDENATDEDIQRVCRLAQADGFIMEFPDGYDTYIEQGGTNVSGGQKQRLCIARALLKKPKILILDDSTSAVDTHTDALIREAFKKEIPDTTKLIIAQRVSSVQDADQIIVLDGGRIADAGTHEELLETSPIYREVYESQQKGETANAS